jgi:hypothetical protein
MCRLIVRNFDNSSGVEAAQKLDDNSDNKEKMRWLGDAYARVQKVLRSSVKVK